jgi:hypothetical protein
VPALEPYSWPVISFTLTVGPSIVFAYGSLPGIELIPYFLALLAWVGMALAAIFLSPFTALIRRLRKHRNSTAPNPAAEAMKTTIAKSSSDAISENK